MDAILAHRHGRPPPRLAPSEDADRNKPRRTPAATPGTTSRRARLQQCLAGEAAASSGRGRDGPEHPGRPGAAAFFDVDNTVMQGASIFHLARGLHRRKFFTTREIAGAAWKQAYFRVVGVEDPEHVAEARARRWRSSRARGRPSSRSSARRSSTRRWPPDLARHPRAGPAAPRPGPAGLAGDRRPGRDRQVIARRLGLTGAMGTVAEHVDGVYTGRLVGDMLHGPRRRRRSGPSPTGRSST